MRTIPIALKNHYAQPYHRLATCWKVTLRDGSTHRFTDHDQPIHIEVGSPTVVETYEAATGYTASNIVTSDALNVDPGEVQGMLVSPSITEEDLRTGKWDFARYEIFQVNWSDLSQGKHILRVGTLGEVSTDRGVFRAELDGLMQALTRNIGELTGPACRAVFGDARCGVDLYPHTVTGTLTGVNEDGITLYDNGRTEPGPGGGFSINAILLGGTLARVTVDSPGGNFPIRNGDPVAVTGIAGPVALNATWIARDVLPGDPYSNIDLIVDTTDFPPYTSGGLVTPLGTESGYFEHGVIEFTTGDNAGYHMEVRSYSEGQITLALPLPFTPQVGDEYILIAGCDKQFATCRDRYSNQLNFRGFPHLPGNDKMLQVGRRA